MIGSRLVRLWDALHERERRWIGRGVLILVPVVVVLGWLEPLLKEREVLAERIRRIQAEEAALGTMRAEWKSVREPVAGGPAEPLAIRLEASLKASGLLHMTVRALDSGAVLVEGRQVPMSTLARWMAEVRRETRSQWGDWSVERETARQTSRESAREVERETARQTPGGTVRNTTLEADGDRVQVRIRFVDLAHKAS